MSGLSGTTGSKSKVAGKSKDLPKAWCRYNGASGDGFNQDSFNVSSLTDGGAGVHTVNYKVDLGHTTYCVVAVSSQSMTLLGATSKTGAVIETRNSSNVAVDTDKISMVVFSKA